MENDQTAIRNRGDHTESGLLTVAGLLNVFWRGRYLILGLTLCGVLAGIVYSFVTKPLYLATGQVRPGVVSFRPDGRPEREWALEDIVNWYSNDLYWKDFKGMPAFAEMATPPEIKAEFIPSLNFVAGGNVITLQNFAPSPELATSILDSAISVFNRQAVADSIGSTLYLTQQSSRFLIRKLRQDTLRVGAKEDRIGLAMDQEKRELSLVELKDLGLALDAETLEGENAWLTEAIATARHDADMSRRRLAEAEKVLQGVLGREQSAADGIAESSPGSDPVSDVLKQTASRELAGRVGELLLTAHELKASVSRQTVLADSLTARVKANELEIEKIGFQRKYEVTKERADVEQNIMGLRITMEKDLPAERDSLLNMLQTERMKLNVISPLERVGTISVSDKPVRPRKLRATAISTILAFLGSLFVVLVWEYLRNNREAITASRHPSA